MNPERRAESIAESLHRMAEDSLMEGRDLHLYACQGPPLCFRAPTHAEMECCAMCEHFMANTSGRVTMVGVGHA